MMLLVNLTLVFLLLLWQACAHLNGSLVRAYLSKLMTHWIP